MGAFLCDSCIHKKVCEQNPNEGPAINDCALYAKVENCHSVQHTQAEMPSWGDVTKGITFSTVGERDVAAEVFSRVARHFGCA